MIHELKLSTEYYEKVFKRIKNFEVRKNDRGFLVGDGLLLKEYDCVSEKYTGRMMIRNIAFILEGGKFGIEQGYVVMSLY